MTAQQARQSGNALLVGGDFPLTARNFHQIADLLRKQSGIHLSESKAVLVQSRLIRRLRALQLQSFDQYCALIAAGAGEDEHMALVAALTTNVTRFFREPHHFEHFRAVAARSLVPGARAGQRLRFWSAGCSSGEEPYSIALALLDVFPDAPDFDVKILATDIDPNVIEEGREGVYGEDRLAPVSREQRERWFKPLEGRGWRAGEALRSLVSFKRLNLIGHWPMRGKFDAIFCRNVVIYFEEATQDAIWGRFRNALTTGGRLYVGHSERVGAAGFESDGLTVYRPRGAR